MFLLPGIEERRGHVRSVPLHAKSRTAANHAPPDLQSPVKALRNWKHSIAQYCSKQASLRCFERILGVAGGNPPRALRRQDEDDSIRELSQSGRFVRNSDGRRFHDRVVKLPPHFTHIGMQ